MDFKLKDNALLKLDYIPVEYIQTSGAVNIDTGISITNNTNFEIDADLEVISNGGNKSEIYGTVYNASIWYMGLFAVSSSITSFNAATFTTSNRRSSYLSLTLEGRLKIKHNKSYINVNGTEYSFSGDQGVGVAKNLHILYLESGYSQAVAKIYNFKVYINNALVRDYIPCICMANGNPALYDKVNETFKYPASGGTFTAYPSTPLSDYFTTMYVKDCPNISGINLLRNSINLTRVRVDIGTQSGTIAELLKYASYSGFNDAYEQQTKPRIVGSFAVTDYWTNAQAAQLSTAFDGLTISYDSSKCIDDLLDNDEIAVQTIDSTKPGYNPAVAIVLNSKSKGHLTGNSWFILKTEAAAITSIGTWFVNCVNPTDTNLIVSDTEDTYPFASFDEFKYFTGVTTLAEGFDGCSNLVSVDTSNIKNLTRNKNAFRNCSKLKNLYLSNSNISVYNVYGNLSNTGDGTGEFRIYSPSSTSGSFLIANVNIKFKKILIDGGYRNNSAFVSSSGYFEKIFVRYDLFFSGTTFGGTSAAKFFDIEGVYNSTSGSIANNSVYSGIVIHFAYNGLVCSTTVVIGAWNRVSMVYVGDGSSKLNDESILSTYTSDSNWSSYSSKLATWWDYNGVYRTYKVVESLTNVTNSNTIEWPYITRGESYSTVLTADEGYAIDNVVVTMYEAVDDGTTPGNPTDITNDVYDSSTGEINIPSVTGNIIITASAS